MWLFAMAVASCATAASAVRLYRVRTALRSSPADLARAVGRAGGVERLRRMAAETRAAGVEWEADLLDDVLAAPSETARVAITNEHLGDLAARLDWWSHVPSAAARLSIAVPLCAVFFALARRGLAWPSVLPTVACAGAGAGAVVSLWAGRRADRIAAGLRAGVDVLVEQSLRAVAAQDPAAVRDAGDSQ
jgi:hypothetical protein